MAMFGHMEVMDPRMVIRTITLILGIDHITRIRPIVLTQRMDTVILIHHTVVVIRGIDHITHIRTIVQTQRMDTVILIHHTVVVIRVMVHITLIRTIVLTQRMVTVMFIHTAVVIRGMDHITAMAILGRIVSLETTVAT